MRQARIVIFGLLIICPLVPVRGWAGKLLLSRTDEPVKLAIADISPRCDGGSITPRSWAITLPSRMHTQIAIVSLQDDTLLLIDTNLVAGVHRVTWVADDSASTKSSLPAMFYFCVDAWESSSFPAGSRGMSARVSSNWVVGKGPEAIETDSVRTPSSMPCGVVLNCEPPEAFEMEVAFPNPFSGCVPPAFGLPATCTVSIVVKDSAESVVYSDESCLLPAARYRPRWPYALDSGGDASSGIYYYELTATEEKSGSKSTFFVRMPYLLLR